MIRKTSYYLSLLTLAASLCYLLVACQQPDKGIVKALPFHNGQENAWGLVNTDGSVCIPAGSFNVQPSAVVGDMFTLPSSQGMLQLYTIGQPATPVTLRTFTRIGYFFDKVTLAQETPNGPILIIDKEGHDISSTAQYPQYDIVQMHNFSNERALFVTREGKYGYMDTEGNVTIPPIYDIAYDFCEEVALVGMNNSQGETGYQLIDPDGQVTGNVRLSGCLLDTRFSSNKLLFKELHNGHLGFLNKQGDAVLYLPTSVLQASRFCHQTITIRTNKGTGCMDDKGQICIPSIYQDAFMADESRVAARHGNQWGLLNVSGKAITSFCFDTISHFYADGYAIVKDKTHYRFINRKGKLTDSSFAFIAEDSIAQRLKPQLFTITQESEGSTSLSSHLMSKATEEKQEKQPETTTGHTPLRTSSHTLIENKDWKKITRRHPFYQEAAKVVSGKLEEQDSKNRRMILNYVEHLRTSYTTKDIDFDQLPNKFVLKTNNGGGSSGVVICKNKNDLNIKDAITKLERSLKNNIYTSYREWPYKNIKPLIFAEQYMEDKNNEELTDYKFYCFNGNPTYCQVITNRKRGETIDFYDMNWQHMPFYGLNPKCRQAIKLTEKPVALPKMIEIAKILSQNIPFVRIDLYYINGKVYFGEITFFPASGMGVFTPPKWNFILGSLIRIS